MSSSDISSIVKEALIRAGHARPDNDLLVRAESWADEIKSDMWARAKKLKSLQTRAFQVLVKGRNLYNNPTDYSSDMTMRFTTGVHYGMASAGSTSSVTLINTETASEDDLLGKEILITSGAGAGQQSQIVAYNPATFVASVGPSFTTAPGASSGYLILDTYSDVVERPIWEQGRKGYPSQRGTPEIFHPMGGVDTGQYAVWPTPYRNDVQPMVLLQNYYADLTLLNDTTDLMETIYRRWQPMWLSGIRWKALQDDDDERGPSAYQEYAKAMRDVISAETYGNDMSQMRAAVVDY